MSTANNTTVDINVDHVREDLLSQENYNFSRVARLMTDDANINTRLKLTYRRGMTKRMSVHYKLNLEAVEWFLRLCKLLGERCDHLEPYVTINWNAVDAIEKEFDWDNLMEQWEDPKLSHITYELTLIKTTRAPNSIVSFDVTLSRLYQLGGHATPYGKKAFREHLAAGNKDYYAALGEQQDNSNQDNQEPIEG